MSDLKKLKDEFLLKLRGKLNFSEVNQIKSELFGKNGLISTQFKKIGTIADSEKKKFASDLNVIKDELQDLINSKINEIENAEINKKLEQEKIDIKYFNIIYEVLDYVEKSLSGLLEPDIKETILGSAEIQKIFKVSDAGKIAGSKVIEGEILSTSSVRIIRDGSIIFTGKIASIFREKNQVKQVSNGQECGITLKDYMDFQKNDTIEAFNVTSKERSI